MESKGVVPCSKVSRQYWAKNFTVGSYGYRRRSCPSALNRPARLSTGYHVAIKDSFTLGVDEYPAASGRIYPIRRYDIQTTNRLAYADDVCGFQTSSCGENIGITSSQCSYLILHEGNVEVGSPAEFGFFNNRPGQSKFPTCVLHRTDVGLDGVARDTFRRGLW